MADAVDRLARRIRDAMRSTAMRSPRFWGAAAVILVLLGAVAAGASGSATTTVRVKKGDLVTTVAVTGTLKAVNADLLGPPTVAHMWNFNIARMAPEGSVVKKGATVLVFDTSNLLRELKEKQAESAEASKQMEKKKAELQVQKEDSTLKQAEAQADLRKIRMLLDVPPELKAANDLKKTKLDLRAAEARVASLRTSLAASLRAGREELASLAEKKRRADERVREIEDAIRRMDVKAPRAGTVIYQADWNGNKKAVGDQCWVGEKVLEVADLQHMKAEGEVDEVDSGKVAPGQRTTLKLDAAPDSAYTGRIRSVWGALQAKSPANPLKVVKLDIILDRTDTRRMMPGMRFTGTIDTGVVRSVLTVPAAAVVVGPAGPEVMRRSLFGWRKTPVVIGTRAGKTVQIISGLAQGDRILERWPGKDRP
jgi:multidrug efflux pump subunit AcrA (membrane-fusion protein)